MTLSRVMKLAVAGLCLATATLIASLTIDSGAAHAYPIADCTTTTGVIVAVDFDPWNGTIERGCDATLTNGLDALHAAGFTTAGDDHDGPAFVCRIDGDPTPSQDPCVNTPPATAYWSYWIANAGQDSWTVAGQGAATLDPRPGSTEGWYYGGEVSQPPFTVDQVRAMNMVPTTVPSTTPLTTPDNGGGSTSGGGGSTSGNGGGSTLGSSTNPGRSQTPTTVAPGHTSKGSNATHTSTTGVTTTSTTVATKTSSGGASSKQKIVNAAPASAVHPRSPGSPIPIVVGGLLVAVLAGGAFVVMRRRRRLD
jgi:hypothetical protein